MLLGSEPRFSDKSDTGLHRGSEFAGVPTVGSDRHREPTISKIQGEDPLCRENAIDGGRHDDEKSLRPHLRMLCFSVCRCSRPPRCRGPKFVLLASTIGPIDAGHRGASWRTASEKEAGIRVRHVGAGHREPPCRSCASKGHDGPRHGARPSPSRKNSSQEGLWDRTDRFHVQRFRHRGTAPDPARGPGTEESRRRHSHHFGKGRAPFISRGDKSGTHIAEMELWHKAMIRPQGSWYQVYEKGTEGNVPTLRYTDQKQAYTVIDRATFLSLQKEIKLQVLVESDILLLNFISLIPVSPQKFTKVNHEGGQEFVKWLTDPNKGQKIVEEFGKDKYGSPLFFSLTRRNGETPRG